MYFNEDIDISKLKTWKDIQNLRRSNENDYKNLLKTYGYNGDKENDHMIKLIDQYREKVRLRREFYGDKPEYKDLINGKADPKKLDQLDDQLADKSKKMLKQEGIILILKNI